MKQAGLLVLWLAVLSGLVAWYVDTQKSFSVVEAIGKLVAIRGKVLYQTEQIPVWASALSGQEVFDGNTISTAEGATAEISLASGKRFEIGPDSQVKLSAALSLLKPDFMVNVLVGNLKVKDDGNASLGSPLVRNFTSFGLRALGQKETTRIRVGDKVIEVEKAQGGPAPAEGDALLDLSRTRDGRLEVKSNAALGLVVVDETTGREEAIQGVLATSEKGEKADGNEDAAETQAGDEEGPEDAPQPTLSTTWADERLVEATLATTKLPADFEERVLWHSSSFRDARVEPLPVPLDLPGLAADKREELAKRRVVVRVALAAQDPQGAADRTTPDPDALIKEAAFENGVLKVVLLGRDIARLSALAKRADTARGTSGSTRRAGASGVLDLRLTPGLRPSSEGLASPGSSDGNGADVAGGIIWAKTSRALTLASVEDLDLRNVRFSLGDATWTNARAYFENRTAPTISPHWFWQGRLSSPATRALTAPQGEKGAGATLRPRVAWRALLDFPDARQAPKFASLLRSGAEFLIEPVPADAASRRGSDIALRFVAGSATKLELRASESDLLEDVRNDVARGLLAWVGADVGWVGREGQALGANEFLTRLDRARGNRASFEWARGRATFHAVFGNAANPGNGATTPTPGDDPPSDGRAVPVEWDVALNHPLFAKALLAKATAFLPADKPRVWLTRNGEGRE